MKKKLSLKSSVRKRFIVLSAILILFIGTCTFIRSKEYNLQRQKYIIYSEAMKLSHDIDGNLVKEYSEGRTKDDNYNNTLEVIKNFKNENNYEYVYVLIPYEDEVQYIYVSDDIGINLGDYRNASVDITTLKKVFQTGKIQDDIHIYSNEYGHTMSVYAPVYDCEDKIIALICVDNDYKFVMINIVLDVLKVEAILIAIIIISMIIGKIAIDKRVVKPIETLTNFTQDIIKNKSYEKDKSIDVHTGDEIELLADSIKLFLYRIYNYIEDLKKITAEREKTTAELEIARRIQKSVIPNNFPIMEKFDFYANIKPSEKVSGDFYDFFFIDDNHLAFDIGDVSGKGIPAALFMMNAKIVIKNQILQKQDLKSAVISANKILCENNKENMFVTSFIAVLEISTGVLSYINAGHNPPIFKKSNKSSQFFKPKRYLVLGALEDVKYDKSELKLESGDSFILYTDGITESFNKYDEMYSKDNILAIIDEEGSLKQKIDKLYKSLSDFMDTNMQSDDMTMVALEYHNNERS